MYTEYILIVAKWTAAQRIITETGLWGKYDVHNDWHLLDTRRAHIISVSSRTRRYSP